jgi:hypothetical protein
VKNLVHGTIRLISSFLVIATTACNEQGFVQEIPPAISDPSPQDTVAAFLNAPTPTGFLAPPSLNGVKKQKTPACDLTVVTSMTFAEFQTQALDAVTDLNGNGRLEICVASGVVVSNELNSSSPSLLIQRANIDIRGLGVLPENVVFENKREDFEIEDGRNSVFFAKLPGSGLSVSNIKMINHAIQASCLRTEYSTEGYLYVSTLSNLVCDVQGSFGLNLESASVSLASNITVNITTKWAGAEAFSFVGSTVKILENFTVNIASGSVSANGIYTYLSTVNVVRNGTIQALSWGSSGMEVWASTIDDISSVTIVASYTDGLKVFGGDVAFGEPATYINGLHDVTIKRPSGSKAPPSTGTFGIRVGTDLVFAPSYFKASNIQNLTVCYTDVAWTAAFADFDSDAGEYGEYSIPATHNPNGKNAETIPFGAPYEVDQNLKYNVLCE